jgi:ParB family transcriptional regulator, chromosome partitioning protein
MWWSMPEAGEAGEPRPARVLALAGTMQRRQRTVLTLVATSHVRPNPEQPRRLFDEQKLGELAASIKAHGILQPLVVRRDGDGFQIVAGERRFRAAQLAGLDRVPALIRDVEDPLELALIENLQREDLSPLEEAEALTTLIARHGYSHREVADLLGKSRPYVSNTLALTRLPDAVKSDLHRGSHGVSRELLLGVARADDADAALALWRRVQLDVLSVRRYRAEKNGETPERSGIAEVLSAVRRLNRALRRLLAEEASDPDASRLVRPLRRTERLVKRALGSFPQPGKAGS